MIRRSRITIEVLWDEDNTSEPDEWNWRNLLQIDYESVVREVRVLEVIDITPGEGK